MIKKKEQKNKGFTLVETLIAISILMISVAAPLSLSSKGLQAATEVKNQMIAFYLAQDGYEWIRNRVSYNKETKTTGMLDEKNPSGSNLSECIIDSSSTEGCRVDTRKYGSNDSPEKYSGEFLKLDSYGFYQYDNSAGGDTIFKRQIKINKIRVDTGLILEAEIVSTVFWENISGKTQEYTIRGRVAAW